MEFFFNPQGIAVVGATPNPLKGGNAILKNLLLGYRGAIFPVNPKYAEIEGLTCYPSVSAVPGPVDLAIVFVPAPLVPAVVEECVGKGVRGVMIESGGFAETGPEGERLQKALADIAARTGIRLWGPNCMGLVDVRPPPHLLLHGSAGRRSRRNSSRAVSPSSSRAACSPPFF